MACNSAKTPFSAGLEFQPELETDMKSYKVSTGDSLISDIFESVDTCGHKFRSNISIKMT
jgi:hypothetical protein